MHRRFGFSGVQKVVFVVSLRDFSWHVEQFFARFGSFPTGVLVLFDGFGRILISLSAARCYIAFHKVFAEVITE